MNTIDFFKLQSKNLHRDFKTKKPVSDKVDRDWLYEYEPKYFDVGTIIYDFNLDEEKLTLMKAQHIIAQIAGFQKWTVLIKASDPDLKIAKIIYENQDVIDLRMWVDYIAEAERMNQTNFDSETKLAICEQVFENGVFDDVLFDCYLLDKKY
ncbi:hypothetical protein [Maribacter hydrothermalis]|uniref:Uncharacterized protein n=1 Tax=Maribacter hydrothermalis TaxID=1836467 RepID=A0A1B7Z8B1_9FLAO|nr:hypothetical protein [Maribacter hydrothermalis]APQ19052.1 hypothetical protein BTR34_17760 [Maribacter hydrothermalis]OBR38935.1 hypothetical protein A9200_04520 [Maribacter hydrothermalis]